MCGVRQRLPRRLKLGFRGQAAGAFEAGKPVAGAHIVDANLAACRRRVDESLVAKVDADVRKGAAHGVEKDQVAGLQVIERNALADLRHLACRSWQIESECVAHDVADHAAAVEAGLGVVPAVAVIDADDRQRV